VAADAEDWSGLGAPRYSEQGCAWRSAPGSLVQQSQNHPKGDKASAAGDDHRPTSAPIRFLVIAEGSLAREVTCLACPATRKRDRPANQAGEEALVPT